MNNDTFSSASAEYFAVETRETSRRTQHRHSQPVKLFCPFCQRKVTRKGLDDHIRAIHSARTQEQSK
jgi:hypothetical protein